MSRPHVHPEDRSATEIKATWYMGAGDEFVPDTTISLKLEEMKRPASGPPYDGAKEEEVILQLVGTGPITAAGVSRFFARRRRVGIVARRTRLLRTPGMHPKLRLHPR